MLGLNLNHNINETRYGLVRRIKMAFDIGQRVISKFYGVGTITSEFFKDPEDDSKYPTIYQRVKFDSTGIETPVQVAKLAPYDSQPKKIVVKKDASQEAYEAAIADGLTHFVAIPFDCDEPNVACSEFQWLGIELASRGAKITIYATEKNLTKVATELATILNIDLDKAITSSASASGRHRAARSGMSISRISPS